VPPAQPEMTTDTPPTPIPDTTRCDVLVVGAGPSGSACALHLARSGRDVLLVDQHDFPRDKTCGDGLIPDAHAALQHLGLLDEVMAVARPAGFVACIGRRGGRVDVPGRLAVLPRRVLDDILARGAKRAGARFETPWRYERHETHGSDAQDGVTVTLSSGGQTRQVHARWLVLATGATTQALIAAGVCERRTPSAVALRGYVRHPELAKRLTALEVLWHRSVTPGYGWIFPGPGGVFNIGVGLSNSHRADASGKAPKEQANLRQMFEAFCQSYLPAAELMRGGEMVGELKGAPLRCTLEGAAWSAPGMLVTGEAAGSTYSFTGEGIGKAMETGILAAQTLLDAGPVPQDSVVRQRYHAALEGLKPRFDLYERANRVNHQPWIADLLIWRARSSERLKQRMAGVLNETSNPGNLVSARGLMKVLLAGR